MKRFFILLIAFLVSGSATLACDVCGAGTVQPEFLREWTHGTTPNGNLDYVIVGAMLVIVLFTLVFSIKFLVRPGEKNSDHIKRIILNPEHRGH